MERKQNLLRPIISRFCDIYVYYPIINENQKPINLYEYNRQCYENSNKSYSKFKQNRNIQLNKRLSVCKNDDTDLFDVVEDLYKKAYSGYDIINYYKSTNNLKIVFNFIKGHFKNEKMLMYYLLFNIFRNKDNLEISSIITL